MNRRTTKTGWIMFLLALWSVAIPAFAAGPDGARAEGTESWSAAVTGWWSQVLDWTGWDGDEHTIGVAPGAAGSEEGAPTCKPATTELSCSIDPDG